MINTGFYIILDLNESPDDDDDEVASMGVSNVDESDADINKQHAHDTPALPTSPAVPQVTFADAATQTDEVMGAQQQPKFYEFL